MDFVVVATAESYEVIQPLCTQPSVRLVVEIAVTWQATSCPKSDTSVRIGLVEPNDVLVARAVWRAAEEMTPSAGEEPGERRHLEPAVVLALVEEFGDGEVRVGLRPPEGIPDWNPQPGGIDAVVLRGDGSVRVGIELKASKVDETLWDILKMAALARMPEVEAGYVVVAASDAKWRSTSDCVALFDLANHDGETWFSEFFFEAYPKAWTNLLLGGSGRPTRVPETLRLTPLADCPLRRFPGWSLRALRVENERNGAWLLMDDWPVGRQPPIDEPLGQIRDQDLTVLDLPAPDADESAYHRFALTTNGYSRMGNHNSCAALANSAIAAWRESGVLPGTIRELRSCLFFEQRRWHHFGEGFDLETMAYLRAIVEKLRGLIAER